MYSRRFLIAAATGSAVASAVFLVVLDRALNAELWAQVVGAAVAFGLFMAAWNGTLIRLDSDQRTTRNVLFEHTIAEFTAVMGIAWTLATALDHLRWQDLTWYTLAAVPFLVVVWLLTRSRIKGEDPRDLFA